MVHMSTKTKKATVQATVRSKDSVKSKGPVDPRKVRLEYDKRQRLENGDQFRTLLRSTGLRIEDALALFNEGLPMPVSRSAFLSWISESLSRRRGMTNAALAHAQRVFADYVKQ